MIFITELTFSINSTPKTLTLTWNRALQATRNLASLRLHDTTSAHNLEGARKLQDTHYLAGNIHRAVHSSAHPRTGRPGDYTPGSPLNCSPALENSIGFGKLAGPI
jgi:hypothetical protein